LTFPDKMISSTEAIIAFNLASKATFSRDVEHERRVTVENVNKELRKMIADSKNHHRAEERTLQRGTKIREGKTRNSSYG
jgi:hypothetical protein